MANFFSNTWFLDATAEVFFPGGGARTGTVEAGGQHYDVLLEPGGRPARLPLADFLEPRENPADSRPVPFLPAVARDRVAVENGKSVIAPAAMVPAPLVDWSRFDSWDHFVHECTSRSRNAFRRHDRKLAQLAAAAGPTRFSLDEPDHRLLEDALVWKSRQLRQTGHLDRFSSPRNRQLLHRLLDGRHMKLAVLYAGDQAVAMQFGHADAERHSSWITAYDTAFAHFSPGVLLLEHMLRVSFDLGQKAFEFLIGDEEYKYHYATDAWLVGPVGRPPVRERLRSFAKSWISTREEAPPAQARAVQLARKGAQRWLQRTTLPGPAIRSAIWLQRIDLDQQNWPRGRLEQTAECQLVGLLARGARNASPVAIGLTRLRAAAGVQGHKAWRFVTARLSPPPVREKREPLGLKPGDRVRVRTPEAIEATLTEGRSNGVYYIPSSMSAFTDHTFIVERSVGRFYDEVSGQVLKARGAVLLRGARCDGSQLAGGKGCDRACPVFWSEAWLERAVEETAAPPAPIASPKPAKAPFQAGDMVRVRAVDEILSAATNDELGYSARMMGAFAGQTFRVSGRAHKAYDERRRRWFDAGGALQLDDVQCPGVPLVGGGRCDRGCTLLWRDAWVEAAAPLN